MGNPNLVSLVSEIRFSEDASHIHRRVTCELEKCIGKIGALSKLSYETKTGAIEMVKTILDHLETRLKSRSRSRIKLVKLVKTHQDCTEYLRHLSPRFEYLRSRCGLVSCFEDLELFTFAEQEARNILRESSKLWVGEIRLGGWFLPVQGANTEDHNCSYIVVTVCKTILRSWWSSTRESGNNNEEVYHSILTLVKEMKSWFRYEDEMDFYTTIQEWLPTFLRNCTLSMVHQKCSWACQYCIETLEEFKVASMLDQMHKFGREILEASFLYIGDRYFSKSCIQILKSVLTFMGQQCQANRTSQETVKVFLELAGYCTVACREATGNVCIILASCFSNLRSNYFSEVTPPKVPLILEYYAISLVINDFSSYKKWSKKDVSIEHVLPELEVHLETFNDIIFDQPESNLLPFFCDRISTLILSDECISASGKYKDPIDLPAVEDILGRYMDLSTNCKFEDAEQLAKIAVAAFVLLLIKKQDTKGFLKKLMRDGKIQPRVLTPFYRRLHDLFQRLYKSNRIDQAIKTLQLCCDALWARVSALCEMVKSSGYSVPSNCCSEDSIVGFVKEATNVSAWLLRLHQKHAKDVNNTLRECIERWVSAQKIFHIPSPSDLVHEWVTIQCQKVGEDAETCDLAPTILSMVPSLETLDQPNCIILEEELHCYTKMQDHPKFCTRMEEHILNTILTMKSRQHVFDRCEGLVNCGKNLGYCGFAGQVDCIVYMCNAVEILFNKDDGKNHINYLNLASETCFLVALIKRLAFPDRKDYIDNIKQGLELFSKQDSKLTERESTLFFYVLDLLSLEGNMELASKAYRILIKRFGGKSEDLFNIAWQSGNLNHGLCSSPLDDYFINIVSDQSFWRTCVESQSLATSFSIFTTLSSIESDNDTRATETQERTNEVIISVFESENPFLAARLYFNIAEKKISKGRIVEALNFAEKGYKLREKLLSDYFIIEFEETKNTTCKRFGMCDPSWVSSLESKKIGTNVYVPTPWNLLKCYLESALQTGTLKCMTGRADEALRKIWRKKRVWHLAVEELGIAKDKLEDCGLSCCKKCLCILDVKIIMELGNLNLSLGGGDLEAAKKLFEKAKSMLEESEWVNALSSPEKKSLDIPVLWHPKSACQSTEDCWGCLPSLVEDSKSIHNISSLIWECIRRRNLLQVLRKLAKCSKLKGDIMEEHGFIMSSMYVAVARSTFHKQQLSTSHVKSLLEKNIISDAFGVEYASVVYHMCCFSLKHKDRSETDILSTESILIGLQMALILSREVPKLHEKVAQMLAVLYASFSRDEEYAESKRVSVSQFSAYFHQLSIGSYFNSCLVSKDQNQNGVHGVLRHVFAPNSLEKLEERVLNFFNDLPSVTIVCISMLNGKLEDLLPQSPTSSWLMISRFRVKKGPVVAILPVFKTFTDFSEQVTPSEDDWKCPWANTVFDQVAPNLKLVLAEGLKSKTHDLSKKDLMKLQKNLDTTLHDFLRDLENSWLGSWKNLLLGDRDDSLGDVEEIQDIIESGCYIGDGIYEPDLTDILKSTGTHKKAKEKCRNPVILVPHINIQMLPFESLPVLEKEEAYRMPSVGAVLWSITKRDSPLKVKTDTNPLDCFYFIPNEEGLEEMVNSFKKWSKIFGFQGKAGCSMTVGELREALESCDLFVYAGHDSGSEYIPGNEISKITNCCAAIVMGCESGYIHSNYHALDGNPLNYLMGGSPVIVGKLWPVRAKTIVPVTKTLFKHWRKATSCVLEECQEKPKKRKRRHRTLCKHKCNLGSSMAVARDACDNRYIDGAAPVIYGVPTCIKMKR